MKKNKSNNDVSWYAPKYKRPIAYSTIAERDSIEILLDDYKDFRVIKYLYDKKKILLSSNELFIIDKYINLKIFKK